MSQTPTNRPLRKSVKITDIDAAPGKLTSSSWPPPKPPGFEFTPHRDGWAKWYRGRTVVLTVKSLDRHAVRAAWDERRKAIDAGLGERQLRDPRVITLIVAAGLFYDWLDHRVATGVPDPLAPITAEDYKRTINAFGRAVGPYTQLNTIGPAQFKAFADTLAGCTPISFGRAVAYVQAFFRWCVDEGHLDELPVYGRYFVKPSQQDRRDVRLAQTKSFTSAQLRMLWFHATFEQKLWIVLGLNGALDNTDLAHLTHEVLDRQCGVIDYRRRKRGKVRRVIPLSPLAWELLDLYRRPVPADPQWGDRMLLTPTGLPLQRVIPGAHGIGNSIDYVANSFSRLMVRAGLKEPYPRLSRMVQPPRERRYKQRGSAAGQGFRALRTTFPNLAPPGYRDEIEIIMGHAHGSVLLDSYLEQHGLDRLKECVDGVWQRGMAS